MKKRLKNHLFSLGSIMLFAIPITSVISCSENQQKQNVANPQKQNDDIANEESKSKVEYNFTKSLVDKFPKEIVIKFEYWTSEQLIRNKIKSRIKKYANNITNSEKEALNAFLEKYFNSGTLDQVNETFMIDYGNNKYEIKYWRGEVYDAKVDLENDASESEIIEKIKEELENLKDTWTDTILEAIENHIDDKTIDKSRRILTFWNVHDNNLVLFY